MIAILAKKKQIGIFAAGLATTEKIFHKRTKEAKTQNTRNTSHHHNLHYSCCTFHAVTGHKLNFIEIPEDGLLDIKQQETFEGRR